MGYKRIPLHLMHMSIENFKLNLIYFFIIYTSIGVKYALCNRPPKFLLEGQSEIVLRLKEGNETPIGSLIYKIKGFDPDGDHLTFGVRHTADSSVIRIENVGNNEANIYLNEELDRENKDEYLIVLTLTDNHLGDGNFITQSLLLLVEDINDNEPIFRPYQTAIEVPEDSRPGVLTTLEATDRDEGAYGQVVYYLQELDGDSDVFSIVTHQGKGTIRLVKELDYERKTLYHLRILAVDRANHEPINTGTAGILVKVIDVADVPPEFSYISPIARVPEDIPVGSNIFQVKAHDGDRGINNPIKFSLVKSEHDFFDINEATGVVFTTTELDRERSLNDENGAYILEIVASEITDTLPTPTAKTEITVILTDVNDETPTFASLHYEAEINENSQENSPVTFLPNFRNKVTDHDQGRNGTFELFLEPDDNIFDITPKRAINEATFMIRVKNQTRLDYEKITELNYKAVAREIATEKKFSTVPLKIYLRDSNDNVPMFSRQVYEFSIPENSRIGTLIGKVQAVDPDSNNFGTHGIRYTKITGSIATLLYLNATTGTITIQYAGEREFDRESISTHYLTVEARDNLGQGNRNTVQIILTIEDINDNAPIFLDPKYEANLYENKLNFENSILQIRAKDLDLNNLITYEILDDNDFVQNFTIDQINGIITPREPLDFESLAIENDDRVKRSVQPIYLTALAKDNGMPSLSSNVTVTIYLHDDNDHAPIFERDVYSVAIPETIEGGSSVMRVLAFDEDGSAPNNQIIYRIQKGASDKFIIAPNTGVISVAHGANLDPDLTVPKTLHYSLQVIALDAGIGDQQLMSAAAVNITVLDVNNKSPDIIDPGIIQIKENIPIGSKIFKIMANDLDSMPMLKYYFNPNVSEAKTEDGVPIKLTDYNFVNAFEINERDGVIKVVKNIDREQVEQIKLGIVVEDLAAEMGTQLSYAFLTIIIDDVNDNSPVFKERFYKRSIAENSPMGTTIVNVAAIDRDKNRTIKYSLIGKSDILELVRLDADTGEISVSKKIDFEVHNWLNYTIRATDSGIPDRSSLVDVMIRVLDENDNNPIFLTNNTNFSIKENSKIGTKIATITATDVDSGDFGKITYILEKISSQGMFLIDANTGTLTVGNEIDREVKDEYSLILQAWDNYEVGYLSGESRNAFMQINIKIIDENDSPPIIEMVDFVEITEYHDPKEVITSIKTKDADDPNTPNGKTKIVIASEIGNDLFKIVQKDPWNANLFAKRSLQQLFGNYSITIRAYDLGVPSNSVEANLQIICLDFNDHAPVFQTPNETIRIAENATIGTVIIQIHAIDSDVGANAEVLYRIKPDPLGHYKTFSIDNKSGTITLNKALNRESQKIYEIHVEAYDQGYPTSLSSELPLMIYVRNVNEYEPQFLLDEIKVNFTENVTPGFEQVKLPDTVERDEVDDLDDPPSVVCYFIVFGNHKKYFDLNPKTHVLSTLRELDREAKSNYTLIIRATEDCNEHAMDAKNVLKSIYGYQRQNQSMINSTDADDIDASEETIQKILNEYRTFVRITVHVLDKNDNPPKFTSKIFSGGVTTSTDFGAKVLTLTATDKDIGPNAKLNFYQIGEMRRTLTEGLDELSKPPFLVDNETGEVLLNFDPQKGMKGYFDFMVMVNDTGGFQDRAHVFIYLLREDQRVRFVLRQQPTLVRDNIEMFREAVSNVTGAIVNVDEFKVHENKDGSVDKTKTDLYLHLVNREDNSIIEVNEVLRLIDQNVEKLDDLFKIFNVLDTQPSEALMLTADIAHDHILVWLILSNIFIGALLIVVLSLCFSQRKSFRRQLRAVCLNAYVGPHIADKSNPKNVLHVPNTNKHSVEGSNPIWQPSFDNEWFNADNLSQLDKITTSNEQSINNNDSDDRISIEEHHNGSVSAFQKHMNGFTTQKNLNCSFNVYHNVEKLPNNGQIILKDAQTTEL